MMKKANSSLLSVTLRGIFRRYWTTAVVLVIVLAGSFGAILLNSLVREQAQAMEEYIATYKIHCTVTDPKGENTTGIGLSSFDAVTLLEDPEFTTRICDVELLNSQRLREPEDHTFCGIRSLSSDPVLTKTEGVTVNLYPGVSEDIFQTNQQVCLIPFEEVSMWPEGVIPVQLFPGVTAELTIIGTVEGGYESNYYIPFLMEWDIEGNLTVKFSVDNCSFVIKDNRKLEEIKEFLWNGGMFQKPEQDNRPDGPLGLFIQDEQYLQTLTEMESNLQLLQILQPVLLILVGCVGLLTGHLTTRSRIKEFAVMRCLGMKKGKIFRLAILEQLMLSLVGLALGLTLGLVISGSGALETRAIANAVAVALIFLVGTGLAATRIAGINVMKLMKVED